jgi:UDP-GlcNAc:undecaprenyl-phosphate GlcNAc-1-phosphate transferase
MATALFFSFLGSLVICMALIPPLAASAGRLHIIDVPGGRKIHAHSVAKVGGIALATGTFIGVLMWAPKDHLILASLVGGLIIVLFGIWDDRVGLGYRTKFAGQALAAFIVLTFGGVRIAGLPMMPDEWMNSWISLPLTFLILIAVTNAVNLADGLDGLAGGLSLISFAGMAFLAFQVDDALLMLMVVSVLGGLLGFLRFNTYPAKIFMGDAGSQFLGFYLGVTGLVLTDPSHGPYSPIVALLLWGLPLLDTLGVMVQRWKEGRSPFVGDRNHFHHKLLGRGYSHREAVVVIYGIQTAMVALAYALRWQADWILLIAYLTLTGIVLTVFLRPSTSVAHMDRLLAGQPEKRRLAWTALHPRLALLPMQLLGLVVPAFLVMSVAFPREIPSDARVVAVGLLVVVAVGLMWWPRLAPLLVRAGLYVGTTFILYFGELGNVPGPYPWFRPVNLFLVGVAVLVALALRLSAVRPFEMTPLDSLMVLLAALLPFLPEMQVSDINLSVLTAKLIVLFFSFELLLHAHADRMKPAGLLAAWLLGGLAIRA